MCSIIRAHRPVPFTIPALLLLALILTATEVAPAAGIAASAANHAGDTAAGADATIESAPAAQPDRTRRQGMDEGFDGEAIETPFDTELTGTSAAGAWSVTARPRTRDVIDNPFVRFPVRARYGVTDHLELFGTLEGYFDNPARSPSLWGMDRFEPGFKWQWAHPPESTWRLALGSSWELPLGRPPEDIQDGFARVRPFAVVTRPGTWSPYLLPYINLGGELVHEPFGRSRPGGERPNHRLNVQPGLLWNPPGAWRGVMELRWRTDAIDGGSEHQFAVRPGVAREVPRSWLSPFGLRGRAEVGVTLNIPVSGGGSVGTSVSARYRFGDER